ncbi:MAG: esterase/lipase family protein, partial [Planctomyces sp.]
DAQPGETLGGTATFNTRMFVGGNFQFCAPEDLVDGRPPIPYIYSYDPLSAGRRVDEDRVAKEWPYRLYVALVFRLGSDGNTDQACLRYIAERSYPHYLAPRVSINGHEERIPAYDPIALPQEGHYLFIYRASMWQMKTATSRGALRLIQDTGGGGEASLPELTVNTVKYSFPGNSIMCSGCMTLVDADMGVIGPSPQVLVHGILGSPAGTWANSEYVKPLKDYGYLFDNSIHQPEDGNSVEQDAVRLQSYIPLIARSLGWKSVHLVAHSKGGLDARLMLAETKGLATDTRIYSLYTINTPHLGSPIAELMRPWMALKRPTLTSLDRFQPVILGGPSGGDDASRERQLRAVKLGRLISFVFLNATGGEGYGSLRLNYMSEVHPKNIPALLDLAGRRVLFGHQWTNADLNGDRDLSEAEAVGMADIGFFKRQAIRMYLSSSLSRWAGSPVTGVFDLIRLTYLATGQVRSLATSPSATPVRVDPGDPYNENEVFSVTFNSSDNFQDNDVVVTRASAADTAGYGQLIYGEAIRGRYRFPSVHFAVEGANHSTAIGKLAERVTEELQWKANMAFMEDHRFIPLKFMHDMFASQVPNKRSWRQSSGQQ